jgi:hypothetical protein
MEVKHNLSEKGKQLVVVNVVYSHPSFYMYMYL